MKRFKNKIALITGSSQGIGEACALRLAKEGADIILNGRKFDERGEELIAEIKAMGGRAEFLAADVSNTKDVIKLVHDAIDVFGALDILVNNAGLETKADFWDVTEEDYDLVMDTNLKGVFFGMQAFVNYCRKEKRPGTIVNMSSVHEEIVFPHFAAYCASKGGLKMLSRNLATELAPFNIRVNNVAPGAISTPINQDLLNDKEQLEKVIGNIPMKRMGTVDDVAAVVAFLASDEAAYVTGSTYYVDGGLTYHYEEQ
ncbi:MULTISPECIES: SDR family NAD(P)-dependent oxidoreductase [unclassified Pedobacter]|uniref:SDR family NAD(P)-dependent oxidoreductase n=1 Tax=unclassified Pedobacter TaxID=2628915 RepID=UPI000B4A6D6E|nr:MULTISPECIES: glucose 1-dehydrogenase [unclassified Pedobacter]MCX2430029.1 glucose 1-dehydrogenase [Pedobacter sp. GR22-10]OWK69330.1 sugar dehydrogenase [Pedobacter sp. AJM]